MKLCVNQKIGEGEKASLSGMTPLWSGFAQYRRRIRLRCPVRRQERGQQGD